MVTNFLKGEEAAENGKELSYSAHDKGMNE
jgi:hypothetical protein